MCTEEIHQMLVQNEDAINWIFCCKQISNMKLVKDGYLVCINCGQVHDYLTAGEYVDFYENRHKIRKKCVYHRKYHIINVMNDIAPKNNIQIG